MLLCSVGVKRFLIRLIGCLPAGTLSVSVARKVVMKMKRRKAVQNESKDWRRSREDQMVADHRVFVTRPVMLGGWLECVRQGLPNHTG